MPRMPYAESALLRAALDAEHFDRQAYLDYTHGDRTPEARAAKAHYIRVKRRLRQEPPRGRQAPGSRRSRGYRPEDYERKTVDPGPVAEHVRTLLDTPHVSAAAVARAARVSYDTIHDLRVGRLTRIGRETAARILAVTPHTAPDARRGSPGPRPHTAVYTDGEALTAVAHALEHGARTVRAYTAWHAEHGGPSVTVLTRRFGSWPAVVSAATEHAAARVAS